VTFARPQPAASGAFAFRAASQSVARIERSEIRDAVLRPDFTSFNPGYSLLMPPLFFLFPALFFPCFRSCYSPFGARGFFFTISIAFSVIRAFVAL
jgi:hypothetical protein